MSSKGGKSTVAKRTIKHILITQPRPESDKSPYFELAKKFNLELEFCPFIKLEGIPAKDFRKQKIDIATYTGIFFTSRNAIDHFFRLCEEMKVSISQDTKYYCITEAVALYLQKFILYRKRKVFFGADGSNKSLFDVIAKHKANEKFLYVCSENQQDSEIVNWLKAHQCAFTLGFMYRSVSCDIKPLFAKKSFDLICFFTPSGIRSLFDSFPDFAQQQMLIGAFGSNTIRAVEEQGLQLSITAPAPKAPSMVAALDQYLSAVSAKK